jgi:hypothetical protein
MPRFILFRGHQGTLVPNPHAIGASPMRVAGQRPRVDAKPGPLHTLYEPCDEVLFDHPDLTAAAAAGNGSLLNRIVADDHTAARVALTPPMPSLPTSATKRGAAAPSSSEG